MIQRLRQHWWDERGELDEPHGSGQTPHGAQESASWPLGPDEQHQWNRHNTALVPPPTGETIEEVAHRLERVDLEDYVDPDGCSSYCHGGHKLASRFGADDQFNDRQTAYSPPSKSHGGRAGTTLGNDNIMHAKVSSGAIEHCCNSRADQYVGAAKCGADWGGAADSEHRHGTRMQNESMSSEAHHAEMWGATLVSELGGPVQGSDGHIRAAIAAVTLTLICCAAAYFDFRVYAVNVVPFATAAFLLSVRIAEAARDCDRLKRLAIFARDAIRLGPHNLRDGVKTFIAIAAWFELGFEPGGIFLALLQM